MINHFTFSLWAGDNRGWALDQTLTMASSFFNEAPFNLTRVRSLFFSQIVVFGWIEGFKIHQKFLNSSQIVICIVDNDINECYSSLFSSSLFARADIWLTHNVSTMELFQQYTKNVFLLPYVSCKPIDLDYYIPNISGFKKILDMREMSPNTSLIFSSQRDSSWSRSQKKWLPKDQKNPQYLLEFYDYLINNLFDVMLVIGGPRRHWLVDQLLLRDLPFIQVNPPRFNNKDDYSNLLSRKDILKITSICDYAIVTSRWEGGPLALLESISVNTLILSTSVGSSFDLLPPELHLSGDLDLDAQKFHQLIFDSNLNKRMAALCKNNLDSRNKVTLDAFKKHLLKVIILKLIRYNSLFILLLINIVSFPERWFFRIYFAVYSQIKRFFYA